MEDLERILEEYLVKDLLALQDTRVGFPTLMTVFAGVELLGSLLRKRDFGTDGADFRFYWSEYLYPAKVRPQTKKEAKIIYEFVRHGVVHHFFPKGRVGVTGSDPVGHLTCREDGVLIIDTKVLVNDFVRVYEDRVQTILKRSTGTPSRVSMQKRLDDIRNVGTRRMRKLHEVFQVPTVPAKPSTAPASSPSGGAPPGPSGPFGSI